MNRRIDVIAALLIALASFAAVHRMSHWSRPQYWESARDVWFDADSDRIFWIEALTAEEYDRTLLHPLYPYVTRPAVAAIRAAAGVSPDAAVRIFHSAVAAAWFAVFFLLLRRSGLRRPDALVFTGMAASSAAAWFWMPAIESFVLGSLTLFPALWLAAGEGPSSPLRLGGALVAGLGVTVTNGMSAFFVMVMDLPWRRWAATAAAAGAVVAAGAAFHGVVFPGASVMLSKPGGEAAWIFAPETAGPWAIARSLYFHAMTAPEIRFLENWQHPAWPFMSVQASGLFTGTRWSWVATPAWAILFVAGAAALLKSTERPRLRATLVATLLFQTLLHLLYGKETFLYTMHVLPLLVLVAAAAARTRWRPAVLALALALTAANLANNRAQFWWARRYTQRAPTLKAVGPDLARTWRRGPLANDPTWEFRFWRDLDFFPSRTTAGE